MHDYTTGTVRSLDFPFSPSPSGPLLQLYAQEERSNAYVTMYGYTPSLRDAERRECIALWTVRGVVQVVFGYPNEDAFWKDPRGELGHGVSEIVGSSWTDDINSYNQASFGTELFDENRELRHYFFGGKDSSAQLLAREVELEVFVHESIGIASERAQVEVLRRLASYPEP